MPDNIKENPRIEGKARWDTVAALTSAVAAIITVAVMFWTAASANGIAEAQSELLETQNEIAESQKLIMEEQARIEKTSYMPEFVYLGPEVKVTLDDDISSEEHYDYGFNPRIAKVSGFAEALTCELYDHYELEVACIDSPASFSQWIAVDVYGHYSEPVSLAEGSSIVMTTEEARAKFCPSVLEEELEQQGYVIKQELSFCAGRISYIDVAGEPQVKSFNMDLDKKTGFRFEESHEGCCGEHVVLRLDQLDRNEPNRGITDEVRSSWVDELVDRLER